MTKYLCAISVQKVQSFLFDALQSHEQEKQTDEYTLKKVFHASRTISEDFKEMVLAKFDARMIAVSPCAENLHHSKLIPSGSGMALFVIGTDSSMEQEIDFEHDLWDFYDNVYKKYQAHMRVSYDFIKLPTNCYNDTNDTLELNDNALKEINNIKESLMSSGNGNEIIQIHQNTLFNFNEAQNDSELPAIDHDNQYFVNNFKVLRPATRSIHSRTPDPNSYYIAFLKADLDGMGDAFKNIKTISGYAKMSNLLNEWVSKDGIARAIEETGGINDDKEKFYPIYAAGDDIFCAVCVHYIPRAIKVYKYILDKINEELRDQKNDRENPIRKIDGKIIQLSIRIGVDITWANQPIRYYWQRAERQMNSCKTDIPELLQDSGHAKIAIGDTVLLDYQKSDIMDDAYRKNLSYKNLFDNEKEKLRKKFKNHKSKDYKKALEKIKTYKAGEDVESYQVYINKDKAYDINSLSTHLSWRDFLQDIGYINHSCGGTLHPKKDDEKRAVTTNHLFNLVEILESGDKNSKYLLNLLYRLIPEKIQGSKGLKKDIKLKKPEKDALTDEAVVWHIVAKRFFEKQYSINSGINGNKTNTQTTLVPLEPNGDDIENVISYVKLLLLFCDPRFAIETEGLSGETIDFMKDEATGDLQHFYTKFLDKLFETGKKEYGDLFKMFVSKESFYTTKEGNLKYISYIVLSVVETSMLFRFKALLQKFDSENMDSNETKSKVAKMINNKRGDFPPISRRPDAPPYNKTEQAKEYNSWSRQRLNAQYSIPKFNKLSAKFDEDFVDLLIVFYSYFSIRAAYKAIF